MRGSRFVAGAAAGLIMAAGVAGSQPQEGPGPSDAVPHVSHQTGGVPLEPLPLLPNVLERLGGCIDLPLLLFNREVVGQQVDFEFPYLVAENSVEIAERFPAQV
jgi:hypothetical protein